MATVLFLGVGCRDEPGGSGGRDLSVQFFDVTSEAGIDLSVVSGGEEVGYILESTGQGACWADVDGDGWLDLYVVNGSSLAILRGEAPPVRNRLYRNRGDGTFEDVTARAGVGDTGWGQGCVFADYDNDGDADLYVTNFGPNVLYRNRGDGTFEEVTEGAGVGDPGWGTGIAWGDYDRDGWLDLYVANYLQFDVQDLPRERLGCRWGGVPVYCGPGGFVAGQDRLYHNRGDGTFQDVTRSAGVPERSYYGFQATFTDLDGDGWLDLYVANDQSPNVLLHNNGDGTFSDVSVVSGAGFNEGGEEQAGMGLAVGDYNGDGRLDLFVTNFSQEYYTLYRNEGEALFSDATFDAGLVVPTLPVLGWGAVFFDHDHDGDEDLFMANGHTYPQVDGRGLGTSFAQLNQLFENESNGQFQEVTRSAGPGLALVKVSRGAAAADYDNDGDLDLLVVNLNDRPNLLRNEGGNRRHWLMIELEGRVSNRDGVGALVSVELGDQRVIREARRGESYLSGNDPRIHFGLGERTTVDRLIIRWPSGRVDTSETLPADQVLYVVEGEAGS